MWFFAASTLGFYAADQAAPADAVEITAEQRDALLAGQTAGQRIAADADGQPILADPLPPSAEDRAAQSRRMADAAITGTQPLVERHRDEVDIGAGTTLTAAQFAALLAWRQAVRGWAAASGWPDVPLPAAPAWLDAG